MSRRKKDAFFAPDLPDFPTSRIRLADDLIDEATHRLAAIDRELAALQRRSQHPSALTRAERKALRDQIEAVRMRRDIARLELIELVELAEMPPEVMGSA
jgi:hypothetical protein